MSTAMILNALDTFATPKVRHDCARERLATLALWSGYAVVLGILIVGAIASLNEPWAFTPLPAIGALVVFLPFRATFYLLAGR